MLRKTEAAALKEGKTNKVASTSSRKTFTTLQSRNLGMGMIAQQSFNPFRSYPTFSFVDY